MGAAPSDLDHVRDRGGRVGAIVVAAGSSSRMEGIDKVFARVGRKPVLWWSVTLMGAVESVDDVAVVVRPDQAPEARRLCASSGLRKPSTVVEGGARRQDSVAAGLCRLPLGDWIVVHDAARPFATVDLVERCVRAARETGAAIAAAPLTDTVKRVADGTVLGTLDRAELWGAQTPQVFRRDVLEQALALADREGISATDESALAELLGVAVRVVRGSADNIKITTRADLELAAWLASRRETS